MNYEISNNNIKAVSNIKSEMNDKDLHALNSYFEQKSITEKLNGNSIKVSPILVSTIESQQLLKSLHELQTHTDEFTQTNHKLTISDEMLRCYSYFSEKFTEFGRSIETTYSKDETISYLAKDDLQFMNSVKDIAINSLSPLIDTNSNFGKLNLREDFQNKATLAVDGIENCINGFNKPEAPEINKSNTISLGSVKR